MTAKLAQVRKRGYALTVDEMTVGTSSVAVPVVDREGAVIASIGVVTIGASKDLTRLAPLLRSSATSISRRLLARDSARGASPYVSPRADPGCRPTHAASLLGMPMSASRYPLVSPPTVRTTAIDGLRVLTPKLVEDERGVVREFYRQSAWVAAGLPDLGPWVQMNLTYTGYGAVRGFHAEATTKLIGVASGQAFGAYVDLRPSSPTRRVVVTLDLAVGTQVLVPHGVGNGFQAVSHGGVEYLYCFDDEWVPGMAGVAVTPLDNALGVRWPVPIDPADRSRVSAKDAAAPPLEDVLPGRGEP